MYKIEFNYRYGKDRIFCSEYKVDNYFVYPLNKEGKPMCTISRTNIISITKDNKTTRKKLATRKDEYFYKIKLLIILNKKRNLTKYYYLHNIQKSKV